MIIRQTQVSRTRNPRHLSNVLARALPVELCFLALLGAAGCGGGGGGGGGANPGTTSFQVSDLSIQDGAVWQINREIVLTFSEPVDFSTVSSNTINIRSTADVPAIGVFRPGAASDPDGARKVIF